MQSWSNERITYFCRVANTHIQTQTLSAYQAKREQLVSAFERSDKRMCAPTYMNKLRFFSAHLPYLCVHCKVYTVRMHTRTNTTHVLKHAVTYICCARLHELVNERPRICSTPYFIVRLCVLVCAPLLLLTISSFIRMCQIRCYGKYFDKIVCNISNNKTETLLTTSNHAILRYRNLRIDLTPYQPWKKNIQPKVR